MYVFESSRYFYYHFIILIQYMCFVYPYAAMVAMLMFFVSLTIIYIYGM